MYEEVDEVELGINFPAAIKRGLFTSASEL